MLRPNTSCKLNINLQEIKQKQDYLTHGLSEKWMTVNKSTHKEITP